MVRRKSQSKKRRFLEKSIGRKLQGRSKKKANSSTLIDNDEPKILLMLTTTGQIYAKILRYLMESEFHHSMLFVNLKLFGDWMAINVDRKDAALVGPKSVLKKVTKYKCYYSSIDLSVGIERCKDFLGSGYDSKGAFFGTIFLFLKKLFGFIPKEPIQNPSKTYCIEYISSVLKYSGVPSFKDVNPSLLTMREMHDLIERDSTLTRYYIFKEELTEKTDNVDGE